MSEASLKWFNSGGFLLTLGHYVALQSVFPQADADVDVEKSEKSERESWL